MGTQTPSPKRGRCPLPNFWPMSIVAKRWMNQDCTWRVGGPLSRPYRARWGSSSPPQKGGRAPNFWPISIVAKRLDGSKCHLVQRLASAQRYCVRWGPSSPFSKGHSTQFSANVGCGQMAGWIKVPPGTELNLGPGNVVLDGAAALP